MLEHRGALILGYRGGLVSNSGRWRRCVACLPNMLSIRQQQLQHLPKIAKNDFSAGGLLTGFVLILQC